MIEKKLNGRIVHKGDVEANWKKAVGFVPLAKEIIIYLPDENCSHGRLKIGDGVTSVNDLPFVVDVDGELASKEWVEEIGEDLIQEIVQLLDSKLDKAGGTIGGDLSIQGNLNVTGTTTTKDTETILVKDNVIVANSDGNELLEEAGFAVKTGAAAAYGIMYDPVGDGVKIGLGIFDENGKFDYTEGEDQFLATRDDNIENNHTVIWDNEKKILVDSGIDHSEYVKFTDIAKSSYSEVKKGIVSAYLGPSSGLSLQGGMLFLYGGSKAEIDNAYYYPAINTRNVGYAVKRALVSPEIYTSVTTDWTEEDKASACETIGAVGQSEVVSGTYTANSIPRRTATGTIQTADPQWGNDATNKRYVDDGFVAKQTGTPDNGPTRGFLYGLKYDGTTPNLYKVQIQAGSETIALRNSNGNFYVAIPTLQYECTNKGYVDNLPDYLTLTEDSTDEEGNAVEGTKSKWLNWLGAIPKIQFTSGRKRIYANKPNGELTVIELGVDDAAPSGYAIPVGNAVGNIAVSTPTEDKHAANKKYVDDLIGNIQAPSVDLTEYAKITDLSSENYIASVNYIGTGYESVPGLFQYDGNGVSGIFKSTTGGDGRNRFRIAKALQSEIDARNPSNYYDAGVHGPNHCKPIVPANLDYAVMSALANSKDTNGSIWTDERKKSARDRLGVTALIDILIADIDMLKEEIKVLKGEV